MRQFADKNDATWELNLNINTVKLVRALLGIDLLDLRAGDPPLLTRLGTDIILLVDIIFVLVKKQAEERGVSDVMFAELMSGEAFQAASTAFYQELVDFFRALGRKDQAQALEYQMKLMIAAVDKIEKKILEIDIDKLLDSMDGEQSTSSPGSSV